MLFRSNYSYRIVKNKGLCYLLFLTFILCKPIHFYSQNTKVFFGEKKKIKDFEGIFHNDTIPIKVSGLGNEINLEYGLEKICLNIKHARVSDLKISLNSPDGTSVWLTNRNGGIDGVNYSNTCFSNDGFNGFIHQSSAPFSGEFIPDGRLSFFNNGQNPNGIWYVIIRDLKQGEEGIANPPKLYFGQNPANDNISNCTISDSSSCICENNVDRCELLPDLVLLESFTENQIDEYPQDHEDYPGQLRFATSIANIGNGPLEAFGKNEWYCNNKKVSDSSAICSNNERPRQKIYQRIYQKDNHKTSLTYVDKEAGTNYFDDKPGHDHYHLDEWVEFRLLKKGKRKNKQIARSTKVSFCLFDYGICNGTGLVCEVDGEIISSQQLPNYGLGEYSTCDSKLQGISVGGYDTYGSLYEGQFIQLPKNLRNGTYILEIEVDPNQYFKEQDESNNVLRYEIQLTQQKRKWKLF